MSNTPEAELRTHHEAVASFAAELAKLEEATALVVAAEATALARTAWLRQEIDKGRSSGPALDEDEVFEQLLAEADADIVAR